MGIGITVKAFPADCFTKKFFDAYKEGQEPDVLTFTYSAIIDGTTTPNGSSVGIGSDQKIRQALVKVTGSLSGFWGQFRPGQDSGLAYLITGSKNAQTARKLALRAPECKSMWQSTPLPNDLEKAVSEIARAYLQGDRPTLLKFEDDDRLRTDVDDPTFRQVSAIRACGYWGNEQLAFAPVVASYESNKSIGHVAVLLALRKHHDQWMLLTAGTDPITVTQFTTILPSLATCLQTAQVSKDKVLPAKLLAPEDRQYPKPTGGQRFGDFVWQPSPSPEVVAQVIEFAYNGDARLFLRFFSGKSPEEEQISSGQLWTTRGMWKWRVWSISGQGEIAFSEARTFSN